jgi:hypothetical protein
MRAATCHPERRLKARGLCSGCYVKDREPFLPRASCCPDRARFTKDGLCQRCAERRRYTDEQTLTQRRLWRFRNYLKEYGLTVEDYFVLLKQQNGRCATCGQLPEKQASKSRLVVDHDHETGYVRGLLCDTCNRALGMLGDDLQRLMTACEYLRRAGPDLNERRMG